MKINDCRDSKIYISKLDPGNVFEDENHFYLVTNDRENTTVTVVDLTTAEIFQIDGKTTVTYIEKVEVIFRD